MFRIIPLLVLSCVLSGCEHKGTRPPELDQLAKNFKDKVGSYRVREGESLWKALPTCRETSRQKISDFSTIVTHDYSRPSYRLTRAEAFHAFGQPDGINGDQVWWELGTNGTSRWQLYVHFHDDYIVQSTFCAAAMETQK